MASMEGRMILTWMVFIGREVGMGGVFRQVSRVIIQRASSPARTRRHHERGAIRRLGVGTGVGMLRGRAVDLGSGGADFGVEGGESGGHFADKGIGFGIYAHGVFFCGLQLAERSSAIYTNIAERSTAIYTNIAERSSAIYIGIATVGDGEVISALSMEESEGSLVLSALGVVDFVLSHLRLVCENRDGIAGGSKAGLGVLSVGLLYEELDLAWWSSAARSASTFAEASISMVLGLSMALCSAMS